MNMEALALRRTAGLILLATLTVGIAAVGVGIPVAAAGGTHILVVDGVAYESEFENEGTIHWYTPATDAVGEAYFGDVVWRGQGSENLPCEGELHWVYTKGASLLVISECVPVAPTSTSTTKPTPPTSVGPTSTSTTKPTPPTSVGPTSTSTTKPTPPTSVGPTSTSTTKPTPPDARPGRIVVIKRVDGTAPARSFPFTASWDGDGFSLADGESHDSGELPPGGYAVSEIVPPATETARWDLISATCDNGDAPGSIVLSEGEVVTCTFVNVFTEIGGIQVTTTTTAPTTTTTAAAGPSTLPFTGTSEGMVVPVAMAVVAIGLIALLGATRPEEGIVRP
jgi:hypothetical protein